MCRGTSKEADVVDRKREVNTVKLYFGGKNNRMWEEKDRSTKEDS